MRVIGWRNASEAKVVVMNAIDLYARKFLKKDTKEDIV